METMCDFDLCDSLDGSPDLDDSGFECPRFDMTKVRDEIFSLDEGLDLVVSHDQGTMKRVANLVVAVNRMKKPLTHYSRQLSGDELCSAIMDSLVDETVVNESFSEFKQIYHRADSVKTISLSDRSKKDIILNSGEFKLQAITLQGGHGDRKVNFKLWRYFTYPINEKDCIPVVLSITKNHLYMSCSMQGNEAVLSLEECSDEKLKSIKDEDMNRFLFFKRNEPTGLTTFESVRCRGWYISTYEEENKPLEMCTMDTARQYFCET